MYVMMTVMMERDSAGMLFSCGMRHTYGDEICGSGIIPLN